MYLLIKDSAPTERTLRLQMLLQRFSPDGAVKRMKRGSGKIKDLNNNFRY